MHIPIFCYNVSLRKAKGKIIIASKNIRTGMIQLGNDIVGIYPYSGITWENSGKIIFRGNARFGNNCYISIGKKGTLDIGDRFVTNAATRIVCANSIKFNKNVLIGWEALIMDTSFHRVKGVDGQFKGTGYGEIVIGANNWFGTKCTVFSGVKTPDYCVIGACSFLNKDISNFPTHIMVAGNPVQIKVRDIWWDIEEDTSEIGF